MTTTFDALANRFGALALRLSDRIEVAVTDAGGRSLSAATALSALDRFLDAPSVGELSEVLGLSSSATVRLVDGLARDGYVTRGSSGHDGRRSPVELTAAGRRVSQRVVAARAQVLADLLGSLNERERSTLSELVDRVLIGLVGVEPANGWMCRLCDTQACGAAAGEPCPITRAALEL